MTDERLEKNTSSVVKNEGKVDFEENQEKVDEEQKNKEAISTTGKNVSVHSKLLNNLLNISL